MFVPVIEFNFLKKLKCSILVYLYNEKWITEELFSKYYKNKLLLISHGGVSSEYMTSLLNIYHTCDKNPETNRPIKGACVHFPYPPSKFNLDKIIYIYGDIYNAILSQIPRHYDNASKLCNNIKNNISII